LFALVPLQISYYKDMFFVNMRHMNVHQFTVWSKSFEVSTMLAGVIWIWVFECSRH